MENQDLLHNDRNVIIEISSVLTVSYFVMLQHSDSMREKKIPFFPISVHKLSCKNPWLSAFVNGKLLV